jgi:hypothetical protein
MDTSVDHQSGNAMNENMMWNFQYLKRNNQKSRATLFGAPFYFGRK